MTKLDAGDFQTRVAACLEREGLTLSAAQLVQMAERYGRCPGKEPWDVRAYRRVQPQAGAREYRVMRGSRVQDVYTSAEPGSAAVVRTALNELEAQDEVEVG